MLKVYPERAADILPILQSGSLNSGVTAVVLNTLELSGAVADGPQLALASILSHPADYSSDVVFQAAVAAGGAGKLSGPELQDALLEIQHNSPDRNLADAAEKALGTLSASNEPLREMLTPGILEMLSRSSSSPGDLANTLWAAANGKITGGGVYTQVQSLLTHPDETVRSAALDYFTATASDASPLALPLLSDSSASVEQAAIKAALASPAPSKEALDAIANFVTDPSRQPGARIVGIQQLANKVTANPWLKNIFQQVLRDNPAEEIREAALSALRPRKAGNPFPISGHPNTAGAP